MSHTCATIVQLLCVKCWRIYILAIPILITNLITPVTSKFTDYMVLMCELIFIIMCIYVSAQFSEDVLQGRRVAFHTVPKVCIHMYVYLKAGIIRATLI